MGMFLKMRVFKTCCVSPNLAIFSFFCYFHPCQNRAKIRSCGLQWSVWPKKAGLVDKIILSVLAEKNWPPFCATSSNSPFKTPIFVSKSGENSLEKLVLLLLCSGESKLHGGYIRCVLVPLLALHGGKVSFMGGKSATFRLRGCWELLFVFFIYGKKGEVSSPPPSFSSLSRTDKHFDTHGDYFLKKL